MLCIGVSSLIMLIIPTFSYAEIKSDLRLGSKGPEVIELQNFLIKKSFLTGTASGNYFSLIRKAVMAYQSANGISKTGNVGPVTRKKINEEMGKIANTNTETMSSTTKQSTNINLENRVLELQNQINKMQNIQQPVSIQVSNDVQISNVKITPSLRSQRIEWNTNVVSDSKILLKDQNNMPFVYNSSSTNSTSHFVNFTVNEGQIYQYNIEAVSQGKSANYSGTFTSDKKLASNLVQNTYQNRYYGNGGNCTQQIIYIGIKDQFGNFMENESITFVNPDSGEAQTRKTVITDLAGTWASFSYIGQGFNQTKILNFYPGSSVSGTPLQIFFAVGKSIIEVISEDGFRKVSPTEWIEQASLIKVDPTTGICKI
jgi:peptidoglycan hydrolase-like protein with peptidoglycan-binding domain